MKTNAMECEQLLVEDRAASATTFVAGCAETSAGSRWRTPTISRRSLVSCLFGASLLLAALMARPFSSESLRRNRGASQERVGTAWSQELIFQESDSRNNTSDNNTSTSSEPESSATSSTTTEPQGSCELAIREPGVEDSLLWQVVNEHGNVFVRASPDLESRIVGMREKGAVVLAKKVGGYLRFVKEQGFVKICVGTEEALMKPIDSLFSHVSSDGPCPIAESTVITDKLVCQAVAVSVGVPYNSAEIDSEIGCKVNNGALRCTKTSKGTCCEEAAQTTQATTLPSTSISAELQLSPGLADTTTTGNVSETTTTSTTTISTTSTSPEHKFTTTPVEGWPNLLCFAVIRTFSIESVLLRAAYRLSVGIFGCNQWRVYSDVETWMAYDGHNDTIGIPGPPATYAGLWLNVDVFARAWRKLLDEGAFRKSEWTVKADPDAVFLPQRLRYHLKQGNWQGEPMVYFKNCGKFNSMQGPLEIFSRAAVDKLVSMFQNCLNWVDRSHIGEDGFMQKCMEVAGIQPVSDWNCLKDLYCTDTYYGQPMFPCTDEGMSAFHPLKTLDAYAKCLHEADIETHHLLDDLYPEPPKPVSKQEMKKKSFQGDKNDTKGLVERWKQCGGTGWTGGTKCEKPWKCSGSLYFKMCDYQKH